MKSSARFVAFTGILAALSLILSMLENLLPPVPGMPPGAKLGLSNIVSMYAAGSMGLMPALALALTKGIFSFVTRGVTAGLMSTSGAVCSTLVVWLLLGKCRFGLMGASAAGALAHNGAQLMVAYLLTSSAVLYYAPVLVLLGTASGMVTALALHAVFQPLERLRQTGW